MPLPLASGLSAVTVMLSVAVANSPPASVTRTLQSVSSDVGAERRAAQHPAPGHGEPGRAGDLRVRQRVAGVHIGGPASWPVKAVPSVASVAIGSVVKAGASLVLATVTLSVAVAVAPSESVTCTTNVPPPTSLLAGVPESAPVGRDLSQAGPEILLKVSGLFSQSAASTARVPAIVRCLARHPVW